MSFQIGNVPSNLRIVDYSLGHTGSAHDATAFEGTAAFRYPDWFFEGEEFAWGDSAYTLTERMIPVHKEPASFIPENALFDSTVSHLRVRSEHCNGALKGRFQCLRGLRVRINSPEDHITATRWVTVAIILHNAIIDIDGVSGHDSIPDSHTRADELDDRGPSHEPLVAHTDAEAKHRRLVAELVAHRRM